MTTQLLHVGILYARTHSVLQLAGEYKKMRERICIRRLAVDYLMRSAALLFDSSINETLCNAFSSKKSQTLKVVCVNYCERRSISPPVRH